MCGSGRSPSGNQKFIKPSYEVLVPLPKRRQLQAMGRAPKDEELENGFLDIRQTWSSILHNLQIKNIGS